MERAEIEREIRRLAPWYHDIDVGGVRTSSTDPCDDTGHRQIFFPEVRPGYWTGKTMLDVGCADGAWSFGALAQGVAHVDAFDVRPENIEKADFVKRVNGADAADFHVASCDTWIRDHGDRRYDKVLMAGILYHLRDPWRTVQEYCALARESVFMGCVLWGGEEDGYVEYSELDNIAASEASADSLMPSTSTTLVAEFAKHGFFPVHVRETGGGVFGGGCVVLFESCRDVDGYAIDRPVHAGPDLEIHLTPTPVTDAAGRRRPVDIQAVLFNRARAPRSLSATMVVTGADGTEIHRDGPHAVDLEARPEAGDTSWSVSIDHRVAFDANDAGDTVHVELVVTDPADGREVARNRARLRPAGA